MLANIMTPVLGIVCVGLAIVGMIALWLISSYNRLVALLQQCKAGWAQIDVGLKRRYDLIPNLVETVKGYAAHERQTLENVIKARNQAVAATGPAQVAQAEGALTGALRQLFAVAEAYPDLKANTNFLQLQGELANTENQISGLRGRYNSTVQEYNTTLMSFPVNMIAASFGFTQQAFFEVQDAAQREAPAVKF